MTEDVGTMRESIREAIESFLARSGGGFQTGFVYAVDVVDSEGQSAIYIGGPLEQSTYRSLGFAEYLRKWYDVEAHELIAQASGSCSGECCNGDDS